MKQNRTDWPNFYPKLETERESVSVCVWEGGREGEREREREKKKSSQLVLWEKFYSVSQSMWKMSSNKKCMTNKVFFAHFEKIDKLTTFKLIVCLTSSQTKFLLNLV